MSPDSRRGPGAGASSDDRPAKRIKAKRSTRYVPNLPGKPDDAYWEQLLEDVDRGRLAEVDA